MKKIKILIIGGTGFLGFHLSKFFIKKKYQVFSLSKNNPKNLRYIKNVKYLYGDISKYHSIKFLKKYNFKYIINCSGYVDHKNKIKTFKIHSNGCKNLLKIFTNKKIKSFLHIGSSAEYEKLSSPHKEFKKCFSTGIYGRAKSSATLQILKSKIPYIIVRAYQVYGPYQDNNRFFPFVINSCLNDESFPCTTGIQLRDFLYIDDFVKAIYLLIKDKKCTGEIFNLGYGKSIKLKSLIEKINNHIKKGSPKFGSINMRSTEQKNVFPSIKKIKKFVSWSPKININIGLKKTINFYEMNIKKI